MGAFQTIRSAIEARLNTNWTSTPIAWDNVPYTPDANTAFIRLIIDEVDSQQASMATIPCHRILGLIHVMIMVPINTGTNTARGHADTIAGIFRNANFSSIQCQSPRIRRVGDIGEWYQYSVLVPFYYEQALENA
jgi:uncharacterized membrane-anchored protein